MTVGETKETCGGQKEMCGGEEETGRKVKLPQSFTTLSTVAIQAGQSLIVVSVLKSGSLVHIQLIQVHPGLCEIGSDQQENQTLIQEQQQLMDKLKKHEPEVLSVVEKSERRKQKRHQEKEEELLRAMTASLKEGWLLLLRLMERRQELLTLASDFYSRAVEFAAAIDRAEDVMITPDDRRTEGQLTYDSMRRDLLGKSLDVLTSCSLLQQKLRQLQRTEALQRRGAVLQEEEEEGEKPEESSQHSRGAALRLEELVETLQDRRRRADQALKLQLQKEEKSIVVLVEKQEAREESFEDLMTTVDDILDQKLQCESESEESADLQLYSTTKETREPEKSGPISNLKSGTRSEQITVQEPESSSDLAYRTRLDESNDNQTGSKAILQSGSKSDMPTELGLEKAKDLKPEDVSVNTKDLPHRSLSDMLANSKSKDTTTFEPGFRLASMLQLQPASRQEWNRHQKTESLSDPQPELRPHLQRGLGLEPYSGMTLEKTGNLKSESTSKHVPRSKSDVQPGSRLDVKPQSTSESTSSVEPVPTLKEIRTPKFGIRLNIKAEPRSDSRSEETRDVQSGLMLDKSRDSEAAFGSDLKSDSEADLNLLCKSEDTKDQLPESRSDLQSLLISENIELQLSNLDLKPELKKAKSEETPDLSSLSECGVRLETRSDENRDFLELNSNLQPESRFNPKPAFRPNENQSLQSELKAVESKDLQPQSRSDLKQESKTETSIDLDPELHLDLTPETLPEETLHLQHESRSNLQSESRSDLQPGFGLEIKYGSESEENTNPVQSKSNQIPGSRSNFLPGSELLLKSQPQQVESGSKAKKLKTRKLGIKLNLNNDYKSDDESAEIQDLEPGFILRKIRDFEEKSRSDFEPQSKLNLGQSCEPEETKDQDHELRSGLHSILQSSLNVKFELRSSPKPEGKSNGPIDILPEPRSEMPSESRSEETRNNLLELKSDLQPGSSSLLKQESKPEDLQPVLSSGLKPESRSEETSDLQSDSRSELQLGSKLVIEPGSLTRTLQHGFKLNLKVESKSREMSGSTPHVQSESRFDTKSGSRSKQTRETELVPTSDETIQLKSNLQAGYISNLKADYKSEKSRDVELGFKSEKNRHDETESKSVHKTESSSDLKAGGPSLDDTKDQTHSRSDLQFMTETVEIAKLEFSSNVTRNQQPESSSAETKNNWPGSTLTQEETKQHGAATVSTSGVQAARQEISLGKKSQSGGDCPDQSLLTNRRKQQVLSCERLLDKIWSFMQQASRVLSDSSKVAWQLSEAEDNLNSHLQLHAQAKSAGHDAEDLKQILDQMKNLRTDPTNKTSLQLPSGPSSPLSPLKALTEQLKTGGKAGQTRTDTSQPATPAADLSESLSPELTDRVDLVLTELPDLNRKIDSNLQLLQPYVTFLKMAQKVKADMEEMMEICRRRPNEEKDRERKGGGRNIRETITVSSPLNKQIDTCWQETLQRFLTCQELGNNLINTVSKVSGEVLNIESVGSVVQKTLKELSRTEQEVNELLSQQQMEIQQQQDSCRKCQKKFTKTLQDLKCVSELLDSCTLMDLGSDLQTNRLVEHFIQATPHFKQLDAEVEYIVKTWETVRGVQENAEFEEFGENTVKEEDLSELLNLQKKVENTIHLSESILDLTQSFHATFKQMEALLQSGFETLSSDAELNQQRLKQEQIQSLLKKASTLKTEICTAVNLGQTCFRVEQLEARLLSLESLCVSWINEAREHEQNELLTRRLHSDINQLRDSFKELKKRFSNLKFNYMKRNDRTRNMKAVRNQLQQVEIYEEKLQALRKRLQGVTARLGSEVKDGGVAREAEDAINELQRQMGEFQQGVSEHQKTLEMTCKLQQAMEEYQFWCEEASGTIARVGKFSLECHSTEAVSVLYRQFEKFVWPTVPQQEERISQISELAIRLHGVEEGQRYIEKTVSKHSEMVQAIRQLSDGLMELEAKLKMENLKRQQKEEEEVEEQTEQSRDKEREEKEEEKDKEKEKKGKGELKKKAQADNRSTQEKAEMYELKETGHTPEVTVELDGKEVPIKRPTVANGKPPLQKSRSQEVDSKAESSTGQHSCKESSTSSYCSTHTFSLSCSPVEANRRIHTMLSQAQRIISEPRATQPPSFVSPSFSDIQREFQRKDTQELRHQNASAEHLQDASAGDVSEAELQQQEEMSDDSLSNDEYECASPDDISLPPLAETPESIMVQSDLEEGYCFSSHSVHINQHSHHYHATSEYSGNNSGSGAMQQQRESSYSTPPMGLHSKLRSTSDSSSLVQTQLTVPASSTLTSTLCSILITRENSKADVPQSLEFSLDADESSVTSGSYPVNKSNTTDTLSNTYQNVSVKIIPSQTASLLKDQNIPHNQPQKTSGTQGEVVQTVVSKGETLLQTDPKPKTSELNHGTISPQSSYRPLHSRPQHKTLTHQEKCCPKTFPNSRSGLHQDIATWQTVKETNPVSELQQDRQNSNSMNRISQHSIYVQSSSSDSHSVRTFPGDNGLLSSCAHSFQTSTTHPQDSSRPQSYQDSRSALDHDFLSSQPRNEASLVSKSQGNHLKTTCTTKCTTSCSVTPQTSYHQSSPSNCLTTVPHTHSVMSKQESTLFQRSDSLPEVCPAIFPNSISNISTSRTITSSNTFSSKLSHQTVFSPSGSLTSTCSQQCVHDSGITNGIPAKPAAPPQPEARTQALAQQANPHVTSLSSSPHLLTPDQDPNICQPVTIREEIKLTPQIQGPPLPAPPHPQVQAESLQQGKASKPDTHCFTRPMSRATVMEGSPVTLEVEVMGHPQPALTWSKEGEASATNPGQALTFKDGKNFPFVPDVLDSDEGLNQAEAAKHHDPLQSDGNSSSGEKWLVTAVLDVISSDWQTWFGTLCVLLWLLYLIVL